MRSLKTLVGFVLILGLLTLGVVGLDYLDAPRALQLAFAILLAGFGFMTFVVALLGRPTAGTVLATAGAALALFVAVRDMFSMTLDLLLFALVIFDVIVLFILFGEIDRDRDRRARRLAHVRRTTPAKAAPAKVETKKVPAKKAASSSTKKAPAKKKAATKKKPAAKASTKKAPAKKTSTKARTTRTASTARFVASKKREGGSFHLVNCYIAQRIDQDERDYFPTREKALEKGHKPCRICNP